MENANELNKVLTREMRTRPHYFTSHLWCDIVTMLEEFRTLLVDDILPNKKIGDVYSAIDKFLNTIANEYNDSELYVIHEYIYGFMDNYLNLAIKYELYECANNINNCLTKLMVKVPLKLLK